MIVLIYIIKLEEFITKKFDYRILYYIYYYNMKKTCREAYDIYTQYNSISNVINEKVHYLIKIIDVYKDKERFGLVDMNTLVLYSEKSIGSDTLSHEQCGRIIHSFSEIKIIMYPRTQDSILKLIERMVQSVMNS